MKTGWTADRLGELGGSPELLYLGAFSVGDLINGRLGHTG